jgi:hypothetical protein
MCFSAHPVSGSAENEVAQITNGAKGTSKARHCTDFVMIAALQYSRNVLLMLLCPGSTGCMVCGSSTSGSNSVGTCGLGEELSHCLLDECARLVIVESFWKTC